MFRVYLTASLFLSVMLLAGGCAKKSMTNIQETPAPAVTETAAKPPSNVLVAAVTEAAAPSIEGLIKPDMRLETVFFDYDSYSLTAAAELLLKGNAEWLLANPDEKTTIEGYCDERGSDEYNLALGERRALAAKSYLASLGVAPGRLAIISYGEERPASEGHDEMAWQKNRRVEFR